MDNSLSKLVGSVLTLAIIGYALVMIVAGPRGTRAVGQFLGKGIGAVIIWVLGVVWRLLVLVVATIFDFLITIGLIIYHFATLHRADTLGDDIAGFLTRVNDRLFSIFSR